MKDANEVIKTSLRNKLLDLEKNYDADVISLSGPIFNSYEQIILHVVENLKEDKQKRDTLYVILTTTGGSANTVERLVSIFRHHYKVVNFIVPDYAFSAGTILCMSGDNIFMDYYSVLGPIDPQVPNKEGKYVPALGYLDKINELIKKAENRTLTDAEFVILKDFDLAELRSYEQAKELTIDLLKRWLVKYKFKNWAKHETNKEKLGVKVTQKEKVERAAQIADKLSDNNIWKSHGRPINIEMLEKELKLKINDFSKLSERKLIRDYYELLTSYISKNGIEIYTHTRNIP